MADQEKLDAKTGQAARSLDELIARREELVEQMMQLRGHSEVLGEQRKEMLQAQTLVEEQVRALATEEARLQSRKRTLAAESQELGRRKSEYLTRYEEFVADYEGIAKELRTLDAEFQQDQEKLPTVPPRPEVPSPTASRAEPSDGQQPGRQSPRLAVAVDVDLESDNTFFAGMTENLSEGGLFVATYDTFPVGTVLDIVINLLEMPPIHASCVVRWLRYEASSNADYAPGMGLQFVDLDEEDRRMITEFLQLREPFFMDGI